MSEQTTVALIAAGAAISGALVGMLTPLFVEERRQKAEQKKIQLEKLEVISAEVTASLEWYTNLGSQNKLMDLVTYPMCGPLLKAKGLADIYFPNVSESVESYSDNMHRIRNRLLKCFKHESPTTAFADAYDDREFVSLLEENRELRLTVSREIQKAAGIVKA